jgi:hypothetical protein
MEYKKVDFATLSKKNTLNLGYWTLAWVLSTALVAFGAKFIWNFDQTASIAAIIL